MAPLPGTENIRSKQLEVLSTVFLVWWERVPVMNQLDGGPIPAHQLHCTDFVPMIDQTGALRYSSALENQ
jgi:hypothetical protein